MKSRLSVMLLLLCAIGIIPGVIAQERAMALEIIFEGVEIKRTGTEQWLRLSAGAQMPLGANDHLRTGDRGRAWLRLADDLTILLLSRSEFVINEITDTDDGLHFSATLIEGTLVQETFTAPADYRLMTQDAMVTVPAAVMEVRSEENQADTVVVVEGNAIVTIKERDFSLETGQGIRADIVPDVATMEAPYNGGRLIAVLDGCPGIIEVDTSQYETIAVRDTYQNLFTIGGGILNGAAVSVMGQSPNGSWLRLQFAHDFGWVIANGVETDCNPPIIENVVTEDWFPIIAPTEPELALLLPLYGTPNEDRFFVYQQAR